MGLLGKLFKKKKVGYLESTYGTGATLEKVRKLEKGNTSDSVAFFNAKEKGDIFEEECVEVLERNNYYVEHRGKELGKADGGIDIVAFKDDKILLIQCKNYKKTSEITDKLLRIFYADSNVYLSENDVSDYKVFALFVTKYSQLAYSGKKWLEGKAMNYYDFDSFSKVIED